MNNDTGVKPQETYDRANENINIGSGNLNIVIPLVHLAGRGSHDLNLDLTYNSKQWTPFASFLQPGQNNDAISVGWKSEPAWRLNIPTLYMTAVTQTSGTLGGNSFSQQSCWQNFVLVMEDGSKYSFPHAAADCWQTVTTSTGGQGASYETNRYQEIEHLFDIDSDTSGLSSSEYAAGAVSSIAQGVLLDLTNFTNNIVVVRFRDGSQLQFNLQNIGGGQPSSGTMPVFPSSSIDANGNVTSFTQNGNNLVIEDSQGQSITLTNYTGYLAQSIQYLNSNGQTQTIVLNSYSNEVQSIPTPTFAAPANTANISIGGVSASGATLASIVLPDGLTYTFQYNEYGEILKITYPSGGYTRYDFQAFPKSYYQWTSGEAGFTDEREVVAKHVCRAPVIAAGTTTPSGYVGNVAPNNCSVPEDTTIYSRTPISYSQTTAATVTDPLGNVTTYQFNAYIPTFGLGGSITPSLVNQGLDNVPLETSRTTYQGASTALETVNTSYIDTSTQRAYDRPFSETKILYPSGMQSQTQWTRDYSVKTYSPSVLDSGVQTSSVYQIQTGNLLEQRDYDFGLGSVGPLLRKTDYSWLTINPVNNIDYESNQLNMLDLKLSETIYDSSSNQVAKTTYEYDNYTGGITASGAIQHGISGNAFGPSYTTRGNITAVSRWRNTDGAILVERNVQFDDTGNVLLKRDPIGNSTSFSYADTWSNTACNPSGGLAAAYVTMITNAKTQENHFSYNSCTGTLATATNSNNQTTSFFYDLMDRRVVASYPDNGKTCLQYSDAPNALCVTAPGAALPIHIVESQSINSATVKITTTVLDGLSREGGIQVNSDPQGIVYVDKTYDSVGRVYSISNPYRSSSTGISIYSYDSLGRPKILTHPDGSTQQWSYSGNAITFVDELGNQWTRTSDALGRLTNVTEPSGLQAAYTYDALNNLQHVTQVGLTGETARNRSFTYDSLSRLLCAANPENTLASVACPVSAITPLPAGVVSYSYDANGNVQTKTDARGLVTNYSYDALNRLVSKTYSGPNAATTASSCYQYDTSSANSGGSNFIGHLTNEWTQPGSCPATLPTAGVLTRRSFLSYDAMDRVLSEQQCHVNSCTTSGSPYSITSGYDLAGNLNLYTNGIHSIILNNSYDGAGRLKEIDSSWADSSHPATLFSVGAYTPAGGIQTMTLGTQLDVNNTYDTRLRITGSVATNVK